MLNIVTPPPAINPPKVSLINQGLIRLSGKSWWQVRYDSGKVVSEWDTLDTNYSPIGASKSSKWEEIPKNGIRELFILCPNGRAGALVNGGSNRYFQLKSGHLDLGASMGTVSYLSRFTKTASKHCAVHIIGKVDREDGHCWCYAWNYVTSTLEYFEDNVTDFSYYNIGPISLGKHTGVS